MPIRPTPPTLTLLSLAALLAACLPDSSDGPGPGDAPRDTGSPDTAADTTPERGLPGDPCAKDTECARDLVCEAARCAVVFCATHEDCGDDTDPGNLRGCHTSTGHCTAQECVTGSGFTCPKDFGLPGTTCDGRVCQEN